MTKQFFLYLCFLAFCNGHQYETPEKLRHRVHNLEEDFKNIKLLLKQTSAQLAPCDCSKDAINSTSVLYMQKSLKSHRRKLKRLHRAFKELSQSMMELHKTIEAMKSEVCQQRYPCSSWTPWTSCSGRCGNGTQMRTRDCARNYGGGVCETLANHETETRECLRDRQCACPSGYFPGVYGYCFKLFLQFEPASMARHICKENGGDLAVVDSPEKHLAVKDFIRNIKKYRDILINGRKLQGSDIWTTWDNRPLNFFKWRFGQMHKNEDLCAVVCTNDYEWYMYPCKMNYYFLCEKDSFVGGELVVH